MRRPLNWTVGFLSGLTTLAGWAGIGPEVVRQYLPLLVLITVVVAASELLVVFNHRRSPAEASPPSVSREQTTVTRNEFRFAGFQYIKEQTVTIRTLSMLLVVVIAGIAISSTLSDSNTSSSPPAVTPAATVTASAVASPETETRVIEETDPQQGGTPEPQDSGPSTR